MVHEMKLADVAWDHTSIWPSLFGPCLQFLVDRGRSPARCARNRAHKRMLKQASREGAG